MTHTTRTKKQRQVPFSNSGTAVVIGTGVLNWDRHERVSDRYGTIVLYANPEQSIASPLNTDFFKQTGILVARVIQTRKSPHIGDIARGLFPTTPTEDQLIQLGQGQLFFERIEQIQSVGLRPFDGREFDWLDPRALYQCHFQTVELLLFQEETRR